MKIEEQLGRVYTSFQNTGIYGRETYVAPYITQEQVDKHLFLTTLQDRNEVLFYRLLLEHFEEMSPLVYTPVVGYACCQYGSQWRRSRGKL